MIFLTLVGNVFISLFISLAVGVLSFNIIYTIGFIEGIP